MSVTGWFYVNDVGTAFLQVLLPVVALVALLSRHHYDRWSWRFLSLCAVLATSLTGLAYAQSWYVFFMFYELITFAGFFLILPSSERIAREYLAIQLAGAGVVFLAIARVVAVTGSPYIGLLPADAVPWLFIGLGFKVGLLGIHFWIPRAHGAAEAPASALLSAVLVKAAVLSYARLGFFGYAPMLYFGIGMMYWAAFRAFVEYDLKRILAYSTVSQLGYILIVLTTTGEMCLASTTSYVLSHAMAKSGLFLMAGAIGKQFGTRDISQLRGLGRCCLRTMLVFLVLIGSLAGLPLTSGYLSKGGLGYLMSISPLMNAAILGAGLLSIMYALRLWWFLWSGHSEASIRRERVRFPSALSALAVLVVLLGTLPVATRLGVCPTDMLPGSYSPAKLLESAALAVAATLTALIMMRLPLGRVNIGIETIFSAGVSRIAALGATTATSIRKVHSGDLGDYLMAAFVGLAVFLFSGYVLLIWRG